jgi:hypothetical protein
LKNIFIISLLAVSLILAPLHISTAQTNCDANLEACEELLTECTGTECPPAINCDDECGWKAIILDKKIQTAIITILIGTIGYFVNDAANP